jgi:hypothetical protein
VFDVAAEFVDAADPRQCARAARGEHAGTRARADRPLEERAEESADDDRVTR